MADRRLGKGRVPYREVTGKAGGTEATGSAGGVSAETDAGGKSAVTTLLRHFVGNVFANPTGFGEVIGGFRVTVSGERRITTTGDRRIVGTDF